jgi:hypothetical protein
MNLAGIVATVVPAAAGKPEQIQVVADAKTFLFTRLHIRSNSSFVRRTMAEGGAVYDLEKGQTNERISHGIALRIEEQI